MSNIKWQIWIYYIGYVPWKAVLFVGSPSACIWLGELKPGLSHQVAIEFLASPRHPRRYRQQIPRRRDGPLKCRRMSPNWDPAAATECILTKQHRRSADSLNRGVSQYRGHVVMSKLRARGPVMSDNCHTAMLTEHKEFGRIPSFAIDIAARFSDGPQGGPPR